MKLLQNGKILAWMVLFVQNVKAKVIFNKDLAVSICHKGSIDIDHAPQPERLIFKIVQWQEFTD